MPHSPLPLARRLQVKKPTFFRTFLRVLGVVGVAGAVAGCHAPGRSRVTITGLDTTESGPISVHVENALGETLVEVDRRLAGPVVEAVGVNPATGAVVAGGKDDRPWIAAELTDSGGGRTLRVLSIPQPEQGARPVFIRIRAPEIRGVFARGVGGPVRLLGVNGPVDVETEAAPGSRWPGGASILVRVDEPLETSASLISRDGDVRLDLPGSSRVRFDVVAPRRMVELGGRGASVADAKTIGERWSGTLNGGVSPAVLRSSTGQAWISTR